MITIMSLFLRSAASFAPPLLAFLLLAPPDRPWPAWAVASLVLLFTRPAAGAGASGGIMDEFLAGLPFLGLALAAVLRFSLLDFVPLAALGLEAAVGLLLAASVSEEARARGPAFLRRRQGLVGSLVLLVLVWLWSFNQALLVAGLEGLAAILLAAGRAGRKA